MIAIIVEPKSRTGQIAAKKCDARIEPLAKSRKIEMNLRGTPKPLARFVIIARTHQQIEFLVRTLQQICQNVSANVSSRTSQENSHSGWVFKTRPAPPVARRLRPNRVSSNRPPVREAQNAAVAPPERVLR